MGGGGRSTENQVQADLGKRGIPGLAELEWSYKWARPGHNPHLEVLSEESVYPEVQKTQVHLGSAPPPPPLGQTEQSVSLMLLSPMLLAHSLQHLTLPNPGSLETPHPGFADRSRGVRQYIRIIHSAPRAAKACRQPTSLSLSHTPHTCTRLCLQPLGVTPKAISQGDLVAVSLQSLTSSAQISFGN